MNEENPSFNEWIEDKWVLKENNTIIDVILKEVLKNFAYDIIDVCLEGLSEDEKWNRVSYYIDNVKDIEEENSAYKTAFSRDIIDNLLADDEETLEIYLSIIDTFSIGKDDEEKLKCVLERVHETLSIIKVMFDKNTKEYSNDLNFINSNSFSNTFTIADVVCLIVKCCIIDDEKELIIAVKNFIKDNKKEISDFEQYHSLIKKIEDKFVDDLFLDEIYEDIYVQLCDLEIDTKIKI